MKSFASLRDRIRWFQEPIALRSPLVSIIDRIQDLPGHFQVLSVALTLHVLCKGIGMDPVEIIGRIDRMDQHLSGPFSHQVDAMVEYAKGELNA